MEDEDKVKEVYVLSKTICLYCSSVGQIPLSLQYMSQPWPLCKLRNSSSISISKQQEDEG